MIVKGRTYIQLQNELLGKKARFISDCQLFPNFDVTGKVISYKMSGSNLLFIIQVGEKKLSIDYSMYKLKFEIC